MEIAVPTLSTDGFATDIRKVTDYLIACYFASDHSQSNVFIGDVKSLAYHVQQYGHDPLELKAHMQRSLEDYLNRHLETARVTVTIDETPLVARYDIVFDATVTKGENSYSVGRLIEIQNSKVVRIIEHFQKG